MRPNMLPSSAVLAIGLLMTPAISNAQDQRGLRDQPIPRELVEGLLSGPMGRAAPSIVVGELPSQLVGKVFIPPGARVLGGTYTNTSVVAILVSSASADSLTAQFRREEPKLGWASFERNVLMTSGGFGFRDAPLTGSGSLPAIPMMFCAGGTTLMVQIDPQGITDSRIRVSSSESGGNICVAMQQQMTQVSRVQMTAASADPFRNARWPMLVNPANARSLYGNCPQNFFGGGGSGTELSTQMTPEELFAHYGRQLADSGWKASANATTTRSWVRTDSLGNRLEFEIAIKTFADAPRCRRLTILTSGQSR